MPYREKVAWVSLGVMLLVYGAFFGALLVGLLPPHGLGTLHALGLTIVLAIGLQLALRTALSRLARDDSAAPLDERERLIELKATRIAFYAMAAAVLAGVFVVLHVPLVRRPFDIRDMGLVVLAGLVVGDLVRSAAKIVYFRRDA
jgi:hypothetical protein